MQNEKCFVIVNSVLFSLHSFCDLSKGKILPDNGGQGQSGCLTYSRRKPPACCSGNTTVDTHQHLPPCALSRMFSGFRVSRKVGGFDCRVEVPDSWVAPSWDYLGTEGRQGAKLGKIPNTIYNLGNGGHGGPKGCERRRHGCGHQPWTHTCPSWRAGSGWQPSTRCHRSRLQCGRGVGRWVHPQGMNKGSCRGAATPSLLSSGPWG